MAAAAAPLPRVVGDVPKLPEPWIHRPRLLGMLERPSRVVALCAPAGAGKSSVVSEWVGMVDDDVAWLTVDARDDDPRYLAARIGDACRVPSGAARNRRAPAALTVLDRVSEQLRRRGTPQVLVLDELDALSDHTTWIALDHLLLRGPDVLRVVLVSRSDPAVSLPRLRVEGRITDIRVGDLSFTSSEADDLLRAHGTVLDGAHVDALRARTEGWAAGLRMCALVLRGERHPAKFVADATRTEAVVADYLVSEVLDRESPATEAFLLRTSVADRVDAELATALTGVLDAGDQLAQLERRGLFLTAADDRRWYRYHSLFGALLQARLRHRDARLARELTVRAAEWFGAHDMVADAISHARRADDWQLVGRLSCGRWLDALARGDDPPVPSIDEETDGSERLPLAILAAAAATRRHDRRAALMWRARAEELRADEGDKCAELDIAFDVLDGSAGAAFGTNDAAEEAVKRLAHATYGSDLATHGMRSFGHRRACELALDRGDLTAALAHGLDARWEAMRSTKRRAISESDALLAFVAALRGHLAACDRLLAGHAADADAPLAASAARVICEISRGHPANAVALLARSTERSERASRPVAAAWAALTDAGSRSSESPLGRVAHLCAALALAAIGRAQDVSADLFAAGSRAHDIAAARTLLDDRRVHDALARLSRSRTGADGLRQRACDVEAPALAARLALLAADPVLASKLLASGVDWAIRTGIIAPLLRDADELVPILDIVAAAEPALHGSVVSILEHVRHPNDYPVVDALTARERTILDYLPTLLTRTEIARELFVSENTVKTHMKALYRKLGVERRRDAVHRARQLGLL